MVITDLITLNLLREFLERDFNSEKVIKMFVQAGKKITIQYILSYRHLFFCILGFE